MKRRKKREMTKLFYTTLDKLNLDERYGHMITHPEKMELMLNLFLAIMSNKEVRDLMLILNDYDEASFIHSFDMFMLAGAIEIQTGVFDFQFLQGAFLHDVGKLCVSKNILQKKGKLTDQEYDEIKKHTVFGHKILYVLGFYREAKLARSHHERMDGTGYPDSSSNEEIHHDVRLLAIMDVYSALTLARPYKPAYSNEKAFQLMERDSFDVEMFEGFMIKINNSFIEKNK